MTEGAMVMVRPVGSPPPGVHPFAGGRPPGWPAAPAHPGFRTPSGLFPSGPPPRPARPTYREPHPVRPGGLGAGSAGTAIWLLTFGLLGGDLRGYLWWTLLGGSLAWLAALALTRWGDRAVAVGIAVVTAVGWSLAVAILAARWLGTGNWPLW